MGYGSYKATDWAKLKNSRGISQNSSASDIFANNQFQEKYDPRFIDKRESCDSADSPQSTPIIIGFDVTGSMGYLAAEIAKNSLNKTITYIYDKQPVTNPHVMCAAFVEPIAQGGLQVTQFEADIRVAEQLLELKVGFGGNLYSFDSLVWYFAAQHTKIDSFDKRGKKGFIFCVGDEVCGGAEGEKLSAHQIKEVYNDTVAEDYPLAKVYQMASEQYEVFHIVTGFRTEKSLQTWESFLPGRNARIEPADIGCLSEVITSIMQLVNGMDKKSVIAQWPQKEQEVVRQALETIQVRPEWKAPAQRSF
ncbi:MAG: hypothetical protein II735_00435 [Clostridia bacterium]|nr:hypothetical protein [Clostridia bacterium]